MLNRRFFESLIPNDGVQTYSALLLLCGVAMLFAIPFAARVSQHSLFRSFYVPSMFLLAYTFLLTVLGMSRGSAMAAKDRTLRASIAIALQVLLGQLLVLPYLIYVRAVLAASGPRIAVIAVYAFLVAFLAGLIGHRLECRAIDQRKPALLRKAALVLAYYVAPFALNLAFGHRVAFVSLLSPIGAVLHILERGSATSTIVAFAIPAAIIALELLRMRRMVQEASP